MPGRLADQIAIVTGGADGIGHAIVRLFCEEGAKVCIADTNVALGTRHADQLVRDGHSAVFVETDISVRDSVAAMVEETVERLGAPGVLVNDAAIISVNENGLDASDELWQRSFAVNVDGTFHCCREVLPLMQQRGGGSIVNLGSVHSFQIVPGYFPYAVTKHAVVGLTRNLAVEYGADNIRVNALCPGMVETPNAFKSWDNTPDPAAARREMARVHPLNRNATTDEIAYPALFLASQESSFMTGQCLIVDGGRSVVYHD